jgi:hypothetical protein
MHGKSTTLLRSIRELWSQVKANHSLLPKSERQADMENHSSPEQKMSLEPGGAEVGVK